MTNILIIGTKNLGPDTGKPGPVLGQFEWCQGLSKRGTLDGVHKAEALPPFRNGDFKVPTLEEFSGSSIEMVPAVRGSKFAIGRSGGVSVCDGSASYEARGCCWC